jgi:hypothetical protein
MTAAAITNIENGFTKLTVQPKAAIFFGGKRGLSFFIIVKYSPFPV